MHDHDSALSRCTSGAARQWRQVATGKITSAYVDRFSCIALAGVATEYIVYGQAEGGLSDVSQLDQLMRALQFSQKKADDQVSESQCE